MTMITNGSLGITFPDGSVQAVAASNSAPQVTTYTSGSGTYTTPTGARWLQIKMAGAGGGGGGSGTGGGPGGTGGTGGNTTFGSSLLACTGGIGGVTGGAGTGGGDGGIGTITSPATGIAVKGNSGGSYPGGSYNSPTIYTAGGFGAISPLGTASTGAGINGAGGAGGGSSGTSIVVGNGGGAGGYIEAIIPSPSATYSYSVGAAGAGGAVGTSGQAGFSGGTGIIFITAYF